MLLLAQVPQAINYQAVARDANGSILMNQTLTIQFSVISDITTLAVSWQETHSVTTNDYGLFTAIIGQGATTNVGSSAIFDEIDWGSSHHFLKLEIDYGGGLVDMGTTAFSSVPYALHSSNTTKLCDLSIGDEFAGGIIFYLDPTGCHGLVVYPYDNAVNVPWYSNFYDYMGNCHAGIFEGKYNWDPSVCSSFIGGTPSTGLYWDDWFLPSIDELRTMSKSIGNHNTNGNINYSNQVPGMISVSNPANLSGTYWSSTEHTQPLPTSIGNFLYSSRAWKYSFLGSKEGTAEKSNNYRIRCIREF